MEKKGTKSITGSAGTVQTWQALKLAVGLGVSGERNIFS